MKISYLKRNWLNKKINNERIKKEWIINEENNNKRNGKIFVLLILFLKFLFFWNGKKEAAGSLSTLFCKGRKKKMTQTENRIWLKNNKIYETFCRIFKLKKKQNKKQA